MSAPIQSEISASIEEAKTALLAGELEPARACANRILRTHPAQPAALHLLALVSAKAGDYLEAAELLTQALSLDPDAFGWRLDLGTVYSAMHSWISAAGEFEAVLHHEHENLRALNAYAAALLELQEAEKARVCFTRLASLRPEAVEPTIGLARCFILENKCNDAVDLLRAALAARTDCVPYLSWMARIYCLCDELELAREAWEAVAAISPADLEAVQALLRICWKLDDREASLTHCRTLIAAGVPTIELYSFYTYVLLYSPRSTPESIREAACEFGRFISPAAPERFEPRLAEAERHRLRVGYLTGEFMGGAPFYFLSPLLANPSDAVEPYCYHTRPVFDDQTCWYRAHSHWRDCRGWSDDRLRSQIREDRIDILIDLSGFFPEHRLGIFAGRAAPVQATFPNCPITTGVGAMDYIFTDRWVCPPGFEAQYSERALRMPSGYLVYAPPPETPPLSALPAERNGFVTFGLFQRRAKMNAGVWDAVADVVRGCPGSRLLIQNGTPDLHDPASRAQNELRREFLTRGVEPDRLEFCGGLKHLETMANFARADIALDSFPYQGQTTTCECLWMGVPVVTLAGHLHVSRAGSALIERIGLSEHVADTPQDYARIAHRLSADLPALVALRSRLRDRLRASPVMDGPRFAREMEAAYRWMWRQRCTQSHDPLPGELTNSGDCECFKQM